MVMSSFPRCYSFQASSRVPSMSSPLPLPEPMIQTPPFLRFIFNVIAHQFCRLVHIDLMYHFLRSGGNHISSGFHPSRCAFGDLLAPINNLPVASLPLCVTFT